MSRYIKWIRLNLVQMEFDDRPLVQPSPNFKFHIDELTKKISRGIGLLYKLRPFVTTKILTIYWTQS